ncbi:Methyl-accepting chemotaxis protein [Marinospirillum celere]|uniref:Methyl-accepting chemotaxis protein n=1 Tax=Marinospirillum celere TaxID=1122252 RepID=A0A1I1HTD9_9GAMM|nr:methyl-accepting chemotaxis protein [Marinospirillum celere]SFC27131.1 Methyl-accepting chemotaxis protein [Marinospirillum celere]
MPIVTITRLASSLLAALALGFALTLYWGLTQLNHAFINALDYADLHRQVAVDIRGKISDYLETGNASQQLEAVRDLEALQKQVLPSLPASIAQQLEPASEALISGLTNEYLGAGKLAGDAQGLLYQNERETLAEIQRLQDYAQEAALEDPATGYQYLLIASSLYRELANIKTYREHFWTSGRQNHLDLLDASRSGYDEHLQALSDLPRLGIYPTTESDSMADLMGWGNRQSQAQQEEKGDEIERQLNYLHNRYPAEMDRSRQWREDRTTSLAAVNGLIDDFEQAILQGQQEVNQNKDQVEKQVKTLFFAFALSLLVMALMLYFFQQKVVINNLHKLEKALTLLVKQGKLQVVDMEADKTELGRIAKRFNQLITGMQKKEEEKNSQLEEVNATLQQVLTSFEQMSSSFLQTRRQLEDSGQFSVNLREMAEEVNSNSTQVHDFASEAAEMMQASEASALKVVTAGDQALEDIKEGQQALTDLVQAVEEVMGILEEVSSISDQTNLLALNAAIEAARAGEQGRGFAVVADEVRQLSQKTQGAVSHSTRLLEALQQTTSRLSAHIQNVGKATEHQKELAVHMQSTAKTLSQRSDLASQTASQGRELSTRQHQQVDAFSQQIKEMEVGAEQTLERIQELRQDVSHRIDWVRQVLVQD